MVRKKDDFTKPLNCQDIMNLGTKICKHYSTHYPLGIARLFKILFAKPFLSRPETSKEALTCKECSNPPKKKLKRTTKPLIKGEKIMDSSFTCLECEESFCGGKNFRPKDHARLHAKVAGHNWVVQYDDPLNGWCYQCNSSVRIKVMGWNKVEMKSVMAAKKVVTGSLVGNKVYRFVKPKNLDSACFNSVLQNVLAMDKLREYFTRLNPLLGPLTSELKKLFDKTGVVAESEDVMNPDVLLQAVHRRCPLQSNQQGHDWLTCLLVGLDDELDWIYPGLESNLVDATFSVQFLNTLSHEKCEHSPTLCERFLVLPLAVPLKGPDNRHKVFSPKKNQLPVGERNKGSKKDEAEVGPSHGNGNLPDKLISASDPLLQNDGDEDAGANGFSRVVDDLDKDAILLIPKNRSQFSNDLKVAGSSASITVEECLNLFIKNEPSFCRLCSRLICKTNRFPECFFSGVFIDQDILPPTAQQKVERLAESDHNLSSPSAREATSLQENLGKLHGDSPTDRNSKGSGCNGSSFTAVSKSGQSQTESNLSTTSKKDNKSEANQLENEISITPSKMDSEDDMKGEHLETQRTTDHNALSARSIVDNPPPILAIQLIRPRDDLLKLHNHVKFKEDLDLKPYMHPRFGKEDKTSYRLIGVVGKKATDSAEGANIAYVRRKGSDGGKMEEDGDPTWFCISDDGVTSAPLTEVLQSEAYNLFYKRTSV